MAVDRAIRFGAADEPRPVEPRKRPDRRAAHQWRRIAEQPFGFAGEIGIVRVADGDQYVAYEPSAAGSLDGGLAEQRAERRVVEPRQLGERRRLQRRTRGELCLAPGARELVPRTHREAIITAINAVAHQRTQIARDRALMLDCQV